MKANKSILVIISFLAWMHTGAQILSKEVLDKYSSGVISKLYDIAKNDTVDH